MTLKSGEVLLGSVSIQYSDTSDAVSLNKKKYLAGEISMITMESGEVYYTKSIIYYSKDRFIEIEKAAILKERLKGEVNLYEYEGKHFNFAIDNNERAKVLQELPKTASTERVQPFRIELINFLGDCIDRQQIFNSKLNENTLIGLINEYNACMNGSYEPLVAAKKRTKILYASVSFGKNIASHSYNAPLMTHVGDYKIEQIGEIDQTVSSTGSKAAIGVEIVGNIRSSKLFFWEAFFGRRVYKFEIQDIDNQFELNDLNFTQLDIGGGVSYRKQLSGILSLDFSTGGYFWVIPTTEEVDFREGFTVHSSQNRKESGKGFYFGTRAHLRVSNKFLFVIGAKRHYRFSQNVMTANMPTQEDKLVDQVVISIGFTAKIFKEGYF
ncbi:MAG: hypothetical protein JJ927_02275 [Balneola sp.]|nr:hypothetical protein [Balneola sp.]MBO6871728.1 hypothetical protein [Balneola sp.]